jgi:acyl-CoA synthetase (AMP-forming)/AMP-acid ligase II
VNNPALTAELVVKGWLDTRDVAWFDAQGGVHVIGREDGTIKKAGNLFHLAECEELLSALPQVVEACCLKIASDLEGEDYVAFLKERGPRSGFDYAAHLATALGIARAPARIVVGADELPRNSAGKYDRRALLATLTR